VPESEFPDCQALRLPPTSLPLPLFAGLILLSLVVNLSPRALAQRQAFPIQPAPAKAAPQPAVVIPTSGVVSIESDSQRADNRTGVITATGNVRILYPDRKLVATARQAQYFSREERVILSGDVDIVQAEGHSIRAERVTYDVITERMVAIPSSGEQVLSSYRLPSRMSAPK
jgi:lipopolysaccharide export system protein LptA